VTDNSARKLGRLPVLTSRLMAVPGFPDYARKLPDPPAEARWSEKVREFGAMLNLEIGDCVLPDTLVSGPKQIAGYHAPYSGDVVTISLASGKRLTVTPNHRVMTDKGFVAAKTVKNGDYLVSTSGAEILPRAALGGGETYLDEAPAAAYQKFQSLSLTGGSGIKVMPITIDFHGDGEFLDGDIDIVTTEGFLRNDAYTALSQPHGQQQVRPACELQRPLHGPGAPFHRSLVLGAAADRDVGFGGERTALMERHARISQADGLSDRAERDARLDDRLLQSTRVDAGLFGEGQHGLASGVSFDQPREVPVFAAVEDRRRGSEWPSLNASLIKASGEGRPTDPHLPGDLLERMPGFVAPDRVVNVGTQFWSGHVYDFSTGPQWYIANGVVTHNCTCAAAAHAIQVWTAANGSEIVPSDQDVLAMYEAVGGYVQGDPSTDNGCVVLDVLNHWRSHGLAGHKLEGYARIRGGNMKAVRQAIAMFGGVYLGVDLPAAWQRADKWDVGRGRDYAPGSWGGHAVIASGYSPDGLTIISWGERVPMTWPALERYASEIYVMLDNDWADSDRAPNGFDFDQLSTDLGYFHGRAP
jgi:hypothetical protein